MVHHLQQDIEEIRMGFFNLIKQQHCIGTLVDRVREQSALIEPNVARRRADKPRYGMLFHVFAHVKANKFDTHSVRQLLRHLGLPDARGAREEETTDGFLGMTQAGA